MASAPANNPWYTVPVLERDEGYTFKYIPWPEGVRKAKARGNSQSQRAIFDRISQLDL